MKIAPVNYIRYYQGPKGKENLEEEARGALLHLTCLRESKGGDLGQSRGRGTVLTSTMSPRGLNHQ